VSKQSPAFKLITNEIIQNTENSLLEKKDHLRDLETETAKEIMKIFEWIRPCSIDISKNKIILSKIGLSLNHEIQKIADYLGLDIHSIRSNQGLITDFFNKGDSDDN
jgi:hypothetical protein